MNKIKKLLAFFLVLCVTVGIFPLYVSSANEITITKDGTALMIPASYGNPYIDASDRTQIPIRAVAEALGLKVKWDSETFTATINDTVKIKIGQRIITTSYGNITMDTSAIIKDERTYVPMRFLAQALGYDISYTSSSSGRTVNVKTKLSLDISAASSLRNVMFALETLYKIEKPNTTLYFNFGASGTLRSQIEEESSVADVFISASSYDMDELKDKKLLQNSSIKNILTNKLVLIKPKDSKLSISSFQDVTSSSVKSIGLGTPSYVPAGEYAYQVFSHYNIWDDVSKKAVFGINVANVLTWVETGNVDCGVVYATDAAASTKVTVVATADSDSHDKIIYPAAIISDSNLPYASQDFINFLSSDIAIQVFKAYGFEIA